MTWTAVLLVAVPAGNGEVFAVLILIGLLVVRAIAGPYAASGTNTRMDVFVYAGLAMFGVFVVRRVFDVLGS